MSIFRIFIVIFVWCGTLSADFLIRGGSFKNENSGPVNFDTDNDGVMDIIFNQNSNLGIGTTAPSGNLHVVGNLQIDSHFSLLEIAAAPDVQSSNGLLYNLSGNLFFKDGLGNAAQLSDGGNGIWSLTGGNVHRDLGNVGIGTSTPYQLLEIVGGNTVQAQAISRISQYSNDTDGPIFRLFKGRGTPASPASTEGTSGGDDEIGRIQFAGRDAASDMAVGVEIIAKAGGDGGNGSWSGSGRSSQFEIYNIPTNSTTLTQRMQIRPNGDIYFNSGTTILRSAGAVNVSQAQLVGYPGGGNGNFGLIPSDGVGQQTVLLNSGNDVRVNIDGNSNSTNASFVVGKDQETASTSNNVLFVVQEAGNVGIGTSSPNATLEISGNILSGNIIPSANVSHTLGTSDNVWDNVYVEDITMISDLRLKENIRPLGYGVEEVMRLRPVTFTWKGRPEKGTKVGMIAQEVEAVMDEVVDSGIDDTRIKGIYYSDIVPVLIKAIQEQEIRMRRQETRLLRQEREIHGLRQKLNNTQK